MLSKNNLGKEGENYTCEYLKKHGYVILKRNFRYKRFGEIDIIAKKNGVISFIEVKTRVSVKYGIPVEAVTVSKQRKIYRCAEYFLFLEQLLNNIPALSFDVVEIIIKDGKVVKFHHYQHCF